MLALRKLASRKPVLTVVELAASAEFGELTEQQKAAVLAFCETHDPVAAIQSGYNCPSRAAAQRLSHDIFARPSVLRALHLFFGLDGKEEFLRELVAAMKDPNVTVARVKALQLYAQTMGWLSAEPHKPRAVPDAPSGRKHSVGEQVSIGGQPYVITALGEDGQPTDAEPLT